MPEPISSRDPSEPLDCHVDDHAEATCSVAPPPNTAKASAELACTTDPAEGAAPPSGARALVERFSSPPALPKAVISHTSLTTSSGAVPGGGSYRVAATGLKAQVETGPLQGSAVELGTAYVQYGKDNDLQVTLARRTMALSGHGYGITVTGQAGVARANLGENNDDGSIGGNLGAGVEALGVEVTVDTPVGSLTYGQSASAGLGGSMGVRDKDHDGKLEFCAKFSIPAYTVGACVEEPW